MNELVITGPTRTAVVSESATVRFIVTSLTLVNEAIKTFHLAELSDALVHFARDVAYEREVRKRIAELRAEGGAQR